jgi:hypothetical protein
VVTCHCELCRETGRSVKLEVGKAIEGDFV